MLQAERPIDYPGPRAGEDRAQSDAVVHAVGAREERTDDVFTGECELLTDEQIAHQERIVSAALQIELPSQLGVARAAHQQGAACTLARGARRERGPYQQAQEQHVATHGGSFVTMEVNNRRQPAGRAL